MRSSLFRDVTQRRLVVSYQRFGTTYQSHLQGLLESVDRELVTNVSGQPTSPIFKDYARKRRPGVSY